MAEILMLTHEKAIWLIRAPVPPILEQALGYFGSALYVAFFWSGAVSQLQYIDSALESGTGDWAGWCLYSCHPKVRPHLSPFHFGSDRSAAFHWFLLDRTKRLSGVLPPCDCLVCSRLSNSATTIRRSSHINSTVQLAELVRWLG